MTKKLLAGVAAIVVSFGLFAQPAQASEESQEASVMLRSEHVSQEVVFGVFDGVSLDETVAGNLTSEISEIADDTYLVRVPWWVGTKSALTQLLSDPLVRYAEPNYKIQPMSVPTDELLPVQWGLLAADYGADALGAWSLEVTGREDIFVAVLDSGIQVDHPDLVGNIWVNPGEVAGNNVDDDGNGLIDDVHGYDFANDTGNVFADAATDRHGTHVAGIIGATANDGGVVGVAQNVKMISVKFINGDDGGSVADAVRGLEYVRSLKLDLGLNIVATNNSWGGSGVEEPLPGSISLQDAIIRQGDADILFFAAAGNDDFNNDDPLTPSYPSNYDCSTAERSWDCVVAVASIDFDGELSNFSNYGPTTVDFAAPGGYFPDPEDGIGWQTIMSTVPVDAWSYEAGTSMATPFVTGAAVLCAAANPNLNGRHIRDRLIRNLQPINPIHNGLMANDGTLDIRATVEDCLATPDWVEDSSLAGVLTDSETDLPIAGAEVELEFNISDPTDQRVSLTQITGADGSYLFEDLPPAGNFSISSIGTATSEPGDYYFRSRALAINENFEDRVFDLYLDPIPTGTSTISGRVINDRDEPIQYMNVGAQLVATVAGVPVLEGLFASTISGPDGTFTIESLPAGSYRLDAHEDGYDMPRLSYLAPIFESSYVVVSDSSSNLTIPDVVSPLRPTGTSTVRVQVWDSTTDLPAPGIRVCAVGPSDSGFGACATSDEVGLAEISGLIGSNYRLQVDRTSNYSAPDPTDFTIADGATLQLNRVEIRSLDPAVQDSSLTVLVRDSETLLPLDGGTAYLSPVNSFASIPSATIGANGEAVFEDIPSGIYTLTADYYPVGLSLLPSDQLRNVAVLPGENRASISLDVISFGGTQTGRILDSYDQPVEGAVIAANYTIYYGCCQGDGVGGHAISDSNGFYTLRNLPLGKPLEIEIYPPDQERNLNTLAGESDETLLIASSPTIQKNYVLQDQGEISGRVVFGGVGYNGANVVAIDSVTGEEVASAGTNGGNFIIRGIKPGDYRIAIRASVEERLEPIAAGFIDRTSSSTARIVYDVADSDVFTVVGSNILTLPAVEVFDGSRLLSSVNFEAGEIALQQSSRSALVQLYKEDAEGEFVAFDALGLIRAYGYRIPGLEINGLPAGNYKLQYLNEGNFGEEIVPTFHDGSSDLATASSFTIGQGEILEIQSASLRLLAPTTGNQFTFSSIASVERAAKRDKISVDQSGTSATVFVGSDFAGKYVQASFEPAISSSSFQAQSTASWALVNSAGFANLTLSQGSTLAISDSQSRLVGWTEYALPSPPVTDTPSGSGGGGGGGGGFFAPAEPVFATPGLSLLEEKAVIPAGSTLEVPGGLRDIFVSGEDWVFRLTPAGQLDQAGYSQLPAGSESKLNLSGLVPGTDVVATLSPASLQIASQGSVFDAMFAMQSVTTLGTFTASATGELDADVVVPRDLVTGDYTLSISALSPTGAIEFQLPTKVLTAVDLSFGVWTKKFGLDQGKMYAKNPIGQGKVQFFVNGKEIAWVRADDDTDRKLRKITEGPMAGVSYLVRTVDFVKGKNALEIYLDGKRVWRAAYTWR